MSGPIQRSFMQRSNTSTLLRMCALQRFRTAQYRFENTRAELPDEEMPVTKQKQPYDLSKSVRNARVVYAAGLSSTGALCIKDIKDAPETVYNPRRVAPMNGKRIKRVAAGCGFSLFASRSELYGIGLNQFYQLGGPLRRSAEKRRRLREDWHLWLKKVPLPEGSDRIIDVSAGRLHSIVATNGGGVFCFGDNSHGQCGHDPAKWPQVSHEHATMRLSPVRIPLTGGEGDQVRQVHCSLDTTFVLMEDGRLYAFGLGTDGQLGNGNMEFQWRPQLVEGDLKGEAVARVSGSTDTIVAVSKSGELFMWGQNEYGQLGMLSDEPQVPLPRHIPLRIGKVICAAATGSSVLVCNSDGEAFTWGSEVLGFGPEVQRLDKPMRLDPPLFSTAAGSNEGRVEWVYAGSTMMAAVTEAGHMFTWGQNRHGNLALGHLGHLYKHQHFPFQVFLPESVRHASFGPTHSLFLTK